MGSRAGGGWILVSLCCALLSVVEHSSPERLSNAVPLGSETAERGYLLGVRGTTEFTSTEFLIFPDDVKPWTLDATMIRDQIVPNLAPWSGLLKTAKRSAFQNDALRSALLYSRATRNRNISEKLVLIFSALESLLLKNESEPITSALADRLAFAVGSNTEERKAIAKNVRAVYTVRSKYVHHAEDVQASSEDLELLEHFLVLVSTFFPKRAGIDLNRFSVARGFRQRAGGSQISVSLRCSNIGAEPQPSLGCTGSR